MMTTDHEPSRDQQRERALKIASNLTNCLRDLDAIGEGVAAAHVSMGLELLKRHYQIEI